MEAALGRILLPLYRLVRGVPTSQFTDDAFEAMKKHLPFERGSWEMSVRSSGEWGSVEPGRTVRTSKRALATAWRDPLIQIWCLIVLHRGAKAAGFTERERKLKQLLVPHLVEAWHANAILHADHAGNTGREAARRRALVDGEGLIHSFEPAFGDLLRLEFPDWYGPRLPPVLSHTLLAREADTYRGSAIAVARLRESGAGMHLIGARPLSAVDRLSAREYAVAHAFAAGRTHKEIAAESGIAPATVRNQLQSAYSKLGVTSKIELARRIDEER